MFCHYSGEMSVRIDVEVPEKCTLVYLQNRYPLLNGLKVTNEGEGALGAVVVRARFTPCYVEELVWKIDVLKAHESYEVPGQKLVYDVELLDGLLENRAGTVDVTVEDDQGQVLAFARKMLEWLPRHAWTGRSYHPEMLAALVQPNDPAVSRLLREASDIMSKGGLPGSWQGYRSTLSVVKNQVIALWKAVLNWKLMYVLPPRSFVTDGQLVRTPGDILKNREATCLDSTMLFASALAHAGLNPLIAIFDGHAFVGCWLKDENWINPVVTDFAQVCNHLELGEVVFFETTLATDQKGASVLFDEARQVAAERFAPQKADEFICVIDVVRAWSTGVQRVKLFAEDIDAVSTEGELAASGDDEFIHDEEWEEEELVTAPKSMTRLDRWQRKLLDLTQRNNLLNMRLTGSTVELVTHSSTELEDKLALDASFTIVGLPETIAQESSADGTGAVDGGELSRMQVKYAEDIFNKKMLLGLPLKKVRRAGKLQSVDLNNTLLDLYRKARSSMEESGSTILYLAIGLLQWTKKVSRTKGDKSFYAPVILLPIEMSRRNVKSDFTITIGDDEPRVNLTLLEVLRMEYGITIPELEGDLPMDENGLDIAKIYRIFREAIKGMEGWTVQDRCFLSTFTFSKYLMWKDLCGSREVLEKSHMVNYLLEPGKGDFVAKVPFPETATLDEEVPASEFYCPLSYDASQLSAVLAAARGKNFVLIGPPGTGKSQTIANMIAQCLAEGKSVLFVAEKVAALSVVYERLKKNNMGEFCLELHSNKANKKQVIDQLGKTREMVDSFRKEEWGEEATVMDTWKGKLSELTELMHREYANGLTMFRAISSVCLNRDIPEVKMEWEGFPDHTRQELADMRALAEEMAFYFEAVQDVADSALRYIHVTDWSVAWEKDVLAAAGELKSACEDAVKAYENLASELQIRVSHWDAEARKKLEGIVDLAVKAKGGDYSFLMEASGDDAANLLCEGAGLVSRFRKTRKELSLDYSDKVIESNMLNVLLLQWQEAEQSWFLPRFFKKKAVKKVLYSLAGIPTRPPIDAKGDLERLIQLKDWKESIERLDRECRRFPSLWKGMETDDYLEEELRELREQTGEWKARWGDTPESALLTRLLGQTGNELGADAPMVRSWEGAVRARKDMELLWNKLFTLIKAQDGEFVCDDLDDMADDCLSLQEESGFLREWTMWRNAAAQVHRRGITGLDKALMNHLISAKDAVHAFDINYCRWWAGKVQEKETALSQFTRRFQEHNVEKFKSQDDVMLKLAQRYLRSILLGRVTGKQTEEYAVLNRELVKQRNHMPLRKLIDSIPNAIKELKPCFLMSPLSIAQYLDAHKHSFDVVIFDEASQIPVWDSIGAIARGNSAVVVGDPKQLPPTNFFGKVNDDGEEEEVEELAPDMESILSECIACGLPTMKLRWHYRSRHESLIAFSNRQYYDGDLVTFPSPVTKDNAVTYHKVDSLYDRGKTHTNEGEARALVDHIVKTVTAPGFVYNSSTSIGVVTFNIQQQKLIQSMLEEERRKDDRVDRFFSEGCEDPIFVKNLESVQGDERGVIYFSLTFGRDKSGVFTMNFGPLNKDGGERRLNVAVTRARVGMHIFTSMTYDQIDLGRSSSRGVADLRLFLEYAEKGARAFEGGPERVYEGGDDCVEESIAQALENRGWSCHTRVGVAGHRIDVGIVDPESPGSYMAGIELDGKSYRSSQTVRDRDKLREGVLASLGWNMIRVWSLDWWQDMERYADELDIKLKAILKKRKEKGEMADEPVLPSEQGELKLNITEEEKRELPGIPFAAYRNRYRRKFADPETMKENNVAECLLSIIEEEGPITYKRLLSTYIQQADISRMTIKIRRHLSRLLEWLVSNGRIEEAREPMLHEQEENCLVYRVKGTEPVVLRYGEGRLFDEIPVSELKQAAQEMRIYARTFPGTDDHLKAVCDYYGLKRLTQPMKNRLRDIVLNDQL